MPTNEFLQPLSRELASGIAWLRSLPWFAVAALLAFGLLGLVIGARYRRGVAAVGGLAAGALAGVTLAAAALRSASPGPAALALICGVAVSALSFGIPWLFPFILGAAIGAPLGAHLPVGVPMLGSALGAVAVGGVLVIAAKFVAASAAGLLGGAMVVAAAIAMSGDVPALAPLAAHPMVAIGVALILAVAGTAAQFEGAWAESTPLRKPRKSALESPKVPSDD